jgi:DNA-binding MarR family transcriptional regulator
MTQQEQEEENQSEGKSPITKEQYIAQANFRYAIRCFLRFSEEEARKLGISPQQYQALLAIKGYPGQGEIMVSELAERLQLRQHSTVGMINRLENQGFVCRKQDTIDRRKVYISLTPEGEALLAQLVAIHRRELANMRDLFRFPV